MECTHSGFHTIGSRYNRATGVLVYVWMCDRCGERLKEASRLTYRPSFDPRGNDRFLWLGLQTAGSERALVDDRQ